MRLLPESCSDNDIEGVLWQSTGRRRKRLARWADCAKMGRAVTRRADRRPEPMTVMLPGRAHEALA
jgi:hypothetical protein